MTNLTPEALHLKQIAERAGWEALAEHVRKLEAEAKEGGRARNTTHGLTQDATNTQATL